MSWLVAFGVVSQYNRHSALLKAYETLHRLVEPLASPIRRVIPNLGQLDLSVIFLLMAIAFVRDYAVPKLITFIPA